MRGGSVILYIFQRTAEGLAYDDLIAIFVQHIFIVFVLLISSRGFTAPLVEGCNHILIRHIENKNGVCFGIFILYRNISVLVLCAKTVIGIGIIRIVKQEIALYIGIGIKCFFAVNYRGATRGVLQHRIAVFALLKRECGDISRLGQNVDFGGISDNLTANHRNSIFNAVTFDTQFEKSDGL